MKKNNYNNALTILLILSISLFGKNISLAQNCDFPNSMEVLAGNNVGAIIQANGDMFWDLSDAGFVVPVPPPGFAEVTSIFFANLSLGALSNQVEVVDNRQSDYIAGPINGNMDDCNNFDQLWEIEGSDIQQHISDFEDNGIIDQPIMSIFNYPALGNQYFANTFGFSLPNNAHGLAPFYDENGDGIYDPNVGDFPLPTGVDKNTIPSHLIWGIYNDVSPSNPSPLNLEIQLTAWAFDCTENEVLHNTIFTSHKIFNGGTETLNSMFAGLIMDIDLGCPTDDYLGCIPDLNTFYGYNQDNLDGTTGCACDGAVNTYCQVVPTQAITILNQTMSSFVPYNGSFCSPEPNSDIEYYNILKGLHADGTSMTIGGTGCQGTEDTKFKFPDNPNDDQGWSMLTANETFPNDFKSSANVTIGSLPPGAVTTIDIGYSFHQDTNLDHLEIVNQMYDQIPFLQQMYDNQFAAGCDATVSILDAEIQSSKVGIFPNPTTHLLNVKIENPTDVELSIFDIYGKNVFQQKEENVKQTILPIQDLANGIYFLKIKMNGKEQIQKFIKL